MQAGELIVAGKDTVRIELHHFPRRVEVKFTDNLNIPPCSPRHEDDLRYEVRSTASGKYILLIKWHVSNVREISWKTFAHNEA